MHYLFAMKLSVQENVFAPVDVVWSLITDIENSAARISGIDKVEVLERGDDNMLGFKWKETRTMFGKEATEVMWITDIVENTHYDTRAESHGSVYESRLWVVEDEGNTILGMDFEGTPQTFGARVMSWIMGNMMKKSIVKALRKDLEDIKAAAEAKHSNNEN